jgi:hypothetical protein
MIARLGTFDRRCGPPLPHLLARPRCSPCLPQTFQINQRILLALRQGQRYSMLQPSECRLPWLALSSAAYKMRWGPTPKAQPDSSPGREGRLVSSVCLNAALPLNNTLIRSIAAMGATFAATESIVANQREKQDALNGVAGGCAAGFLAGIRGACCCQGCCGL